MQDHPAQKLIKTPSGIVSVGVILNLLETLIVGFFVWVSIEISDPVFGPSFNLDAYFKQTKIEVLILVLSISRIYSQGSRHTRIYDAEGAKPPEIARYVATRCGDNP